MSNPHHTHDDIPPHDDSPNEVSGHSYAADSLHGHTHGAVDPSIITTKRGIWAIKWSFVGLGMAVTLTKSPTSTPTPT